MRRVNPVDDPPCLKSSSPICVEQKCTARAGLRQRLPKELSAGLSPEDPELYQGGWPQEIVFQEFSTMRRGAKGLSAESTRRQPVRRLDGVDAVQTRERQLRTGGGAEDFWKRPLSDGIAREFLTTLDVTRIPQKRVDVAALFLGLLVQQAQITVLERCLSFRVRF